MCGPPDLEMRRATLAGSPQSQGKFNTDENSKLSRAIQVARRHREKPSPSIERAIRKQAEMEDTRLDREIEEHCRKVFESYEDDLLAHAKLRRVE
jgi:hypothetical protein